MGLRGGAVGRVSALGAGRAGVVALAIVVTGLAPGRADDAPASSQQDAAVFATAAAAFLARDNIVVPDRSQAYPARSTAREGCGALPKGTRYAIDGDPADWHGVATAINGTGRYDRGEYVWTDYPFDDGGTGRLRYPGEGEATAASEGGVATVSPRMQRYGANAADIVDMRFATDDRFFYVRATTNFLNAPDSTVIGIGLDTDPRPGLSAWPRGARVAAPGLDVFVTLAAGCGWVTTEGGESSIATAGGAAAVDLATNTFEAAIPRSLLGTAASVKVVGGSGLWDAAAEQWLAPVTGGAATNATDVPTGAATASDPAVFNLAFRYEPMIDANDVLDTGSSTSSKRVFQTRRQEEILATGTTGDASVVIDLTRTSRGAAPDPIMLRPATGDTSFTRSYRSRIDLEGVLFAGNQLIYLSRYQPYAVYLPAGTGQGHPLAVMFHGGDGSHVNELSEEAGVRVATKLDEKAGAITMAPLGRGRRQPWWRGLGEADVIEAVEATRAAYNTDRDRQLATGGSLGGYATIRLSSIYPDAWAGAVASCPAEYENSTSTRAIGNEAPATQQFVIDSVLPSLLHVPYRQISGTGDPLVRIDSGHRLRDAALDAQLDVGYTEYPNSSHCFLVPSIAGGWMDNHATEMAMLLHAGRETSPARVRYVVDARHYPAATETIGIADVRDVGLGYAGAYWLRGLQVRQAVEIAATSPGRAIAGNTVGGPGSEVVAVADVASRALPGWRLETTDCGASVGLAGTGTGGNPYAEPDGGGTSGLTWNNPNTWRCQAQSWDGEAESVLDVTTRNLAVVGIDVEGAGLDPRDGFEMRVVGDGPLVVRFLGLRTATASGDCVTSTAVAEDAFEVSVTSSAATCSVRVFR